MTHRITVLAWPGLDVSLLLAPGVVAGRSERVDEELATLDSADRCLARAGIVVARSVDGWLLEIAGYGSATVVAAGAGEPVEPKLLAVLGAVSRGRTLRYLVRERRRGRWSALVVREHDDALGEVTVREVGRILDEDVSTVDGRRVVSRQRYVTVEAEDWVIDWVRDRVHGLGMSSQVAAAVAPPPPVGPSDPMPWPLTRRPDTRTVLQRGLAGAVGELLRHDPVVRLDLHVEGVHRMRVAIRVLRSQLRTFAPLFDDVPDSVLDDLRWLARLLGHVRDLDVLRSVVRSVLKLLEPPERSRSQFLLDEIAAERLQRLEDLHAAMGTERYAALLDRLVALAVDPPFSADAASSPERVLVPVARRTFRRLRRAAKAATAEAASVEAVHAVRLGAKRFRYVLDAISEALPGAAQQAQELARLQRILGRFNDAAQAEHWLTQRALCESDPTRTFVLGGLVMELHRRGDIHRSAWVKSWRRVKAPKRSAWLEG